MLTALDEAIDEMLALDPDALSDAQLHSFVVELQRAAGRLVAVRAKHVEAWRARRVWADDGSRSAASRLARECRLSGHTARAELRRARRLGTMPATTEALSSGKLSVDQADVLMHANQPPVAALFARDEGLLVDDLKTLDFADGLRCVRYWQQAAADELDQEPACCRSPRRRASATRDLDGTVDVRATLDAVEGTEFLTELQRRYDDLFAADWAAARNEHGPALSPDELTARLGRTTAQRRADALCEMARRSAAVPAGARAPAPLLTIHVGGGAFARLCELADGTVIGPDVVVPHLGRCQIERIVFDGPSRVIDVGARRSFTGALRRAIEARDRHCQHPGGCEVAAGECDIDHIIPACYGGPTTQDNGRCLCPHHNRHRPDHDGRPPPADDS